MSRSATITIAVDGDEVFTHEASGPDEEGLARLAFTCYRWAGMPGYRTDGEVTARVDWHDDEDGGDA